MATVNFTRDSSTGAGVGIKWTPLTTVNADGLPFDTLDFADISVQVLGTFGAAGNIIIEGSNQSTPTTWATLNDPQGNALSTVTSARIEQILEMPRWIRPRLSAGEAGVSSLTVELWARRSR
jgi:hypothetical protein